MNKRKGQKQHYVPQFLLRHWRGFDKKVGVFRKDVSGLPYSRLSPRSTGFEQGVYSFQGVPEEDIDLVEEKVMKPIDSNGAQVINKILESGLSEIYNKDIDWILVLIASLELRDPVHLQNMKEVVHSLMTDELEGGSQLETELLKFIEGHPEISSNLLLRKLGSYIHDRAQIFKKELGYFGLVDFTGQRDYLLLSDYPCIRTTGVGNPDVVLALPISPWKAILVFKTDEARQKLSGDIRHPYLLSAINRDSFHQATSRIYALDETPKHFLEAML